MRMIQLGKTPKEVLIINNKTKSNGKSELALLSSRLIANWGKETPRSMLFSGANSEQKRW